MDNLIAPYGGKLANPMAEKVRARELRREALHLPSLDLNRRQISDLEMLLNGGFSPLTRFMGRADYESVLERMQLADGTFWPLPVTLDLPDKAAGLLEAGGRVALRDPEGFLLAVLTVGEVWQPDKAREAEALFGTTDPAHPGAGYLMRQVGSHYVSGHLEGLSLPQHFDYPMLRLAPEELRKSFLRRGWRRVIAYQAHFPPHRAQYEFTRRAVLEREANLLIHAVTAVDPADSPDHFTLVRSCQAILPRYPAASADVALLPMSRHLERARGVLLRAIVARNYGCTHLIVGGEQDDSGDHRRGRDVSDSREFQRLSQQAEAVGVALIPFPRMVYVEERVQYMPQEEAPPGARNLVLPGAEFRRRLAEGLEIPEWHSYPEVVAELRKTHPPRSRQGFTVFFTGLSGSGKSTLAKALMVKLQEIGGRQVTLLDGDIVRKHLSSELGFSREHRDINIRRIGFVASEITKNRGAAICAPIAPYATTRRAVREMIEPLGGFFEIHVSTPLEVCESRDCKGLYAKARAGIIKEFTGISDAYETPESPELALDTSDISVDEAVQRILLKLEQKGYLKI